MNTALLWIGGLLVAVFCALFAIPHVVDWDRYRGVFEEEATRMLGRDVRVGGAVSLRFLPAPYVQFDKIKVADTERGSGEAFFRADGLTIWLSIAPLLRGAIEAKEIELKKPHLLIKVDKDGQPNWRTLKVSAGNLPFVPTEVSLKALRVSDGIIAVRGEGDRELAYLRSINGEISAEALAGPYKFRGDLDWNGEPREIRVATAAMDAAGRLRVKLTVKAGKFGGSYGLDGTLSDIALSPKLEGELSAKLPIDLEGSSDDQSAAVRSPGNPALASGAELKAQIAATPVGLKLTDLALSFEQAGQPQLLAGSLTASWAGQPRLDATLDSRWLDLDRIIGQGGSASPLSTAHALLTATAGLIPDEAHLRASLKVDQVTLGGDTVSGISMTMARRNQELEIEDFRASLPGGTKVDLSGILASGRDADGFKGEIAVRGASLQRFATWLARGQSIAEARADRPFALQSVLQLSRRSVEFKSATAEFAGSTISGGLRYAWAGRKQLAVDVEASTIDLAGIFPGALSLAKVRDVFWPVPESGVPIGNAASGRWLDPATADISLGVRAGTLTDGDQELRDVAVDVRLQNRTLVVADLRLKSPAGLQIEANGQVTDNSGKAKGTLRGLVAAANPDAAAELWRLLGVRSANEDAAPGGRLDVAPLRLAGSIGFGNAPAGSVDISADGLLRGSRIVASARLDGGLDNWRAAPVDITAAVESPDVARFLQPVLKSKAQLRERRGLPPAPGRLTLKASGVPADAVVGLARLEAPGFNLALSGRGTWAGKGDPKFAGELTVDTPDAAQAAAIAGWMTPAGAVGVGIEGTADVELSEGVLLIVPRGTMVGGGPVAGFISIRPDADRSRFEARLATREVALSRLLGMVTESGGPSRTTPQSADAAAEPWPDQPFDFGGLTQTSGRIALETDKLTMADGMSLQSAVLEAEIAPGTVKVTKLEGDALGGRISSELTLSQIAAGAELNVDVRLTDARLDALRPRRGGGGDVKGTGSLVFKASGRGPTPHGLLNTLTGRGEAELTSAAVTGLSPNAVGSAIDSLIAGKFDPGKDGSRTALVNALEPGSLALASRKIPVTLSDGALRIDPFTVEEARGRVSNRTTVELATLKVDSEWTIEPKVSARATTPARPFLPAISVVYVGSLRDVARLEPKVSTEALERELAVRKMELDVDELERVRRRDEERAKLEAERLKAIESDRQGTRPEPAPQRGGWGATMQAPLAPVDQPASRSPPGSTAVPEPPEPPRPPLQQGRSGLTNAPSGPVTGTRWYDAPDWRKAGSPITGQGGN